MEGIVGKKGQIAMQKTDTISKTVTYWQGEYFEDAQSLVGEYGPDIDEAVDAFKIFRVATVTDDKASKFVELIWDTYDPHKTGVLSKATTMTFYVKTYPNTSV